MDQPTGVGYNGGMKEEKKNRVGESSERELSIHRALAIEERVEAGSWGTCTSCWYPTPTIRLVENTCPDCRGEDTRVTGGEGSWTPSWR